MLALLANRISLKNSFKRAMEILPGMAAIGASVVAAGEEAIANPLPTFATIMKESYGTRMKVSRTAPPIRMLMLCSLLSRRRCLLTLHGLVTS
jgi:hypothetical protein